ncbi:MAG: Hsp20/alpha crystallin family protein [Candidatus Peribacteraceae bacterium]
MEIIPQDDFCLQGTRFLCVSSGKFGRLERMIPSSFHGIFSSAMNGEKRARAVAARSMKGDSSLSAEEIAVPTRSQEGHRSLKGQVALDVFEFDEYYIIKAPIAGVKLSDIDIEVTDNVVTIRGIRRQTDDVPVNQYYVQECFWGEFERSVTLPTAVDQRKIKATFNKESILKIIIPKEERVKIVRIND